MKRQFAIFIISSIVIAVAGLVYSLQSLAQVLTVSPDGLPPPGAVIQLNPDQMKTVRIADLAKAQKVVRHRLDQLALPGYYAVQMQGNHLRVTLPHGEDTLYIVNILTRVGDVRFVDGGKRPASGRQYDQTAANLAGYPTLFARDDIQATIVPNAELGEIFYQITLSPAAANRFEAFNRQDDHYMCLALDGQLTNCTQMYHWSGQTIDILPGATGDFSLADIVIFLRSGPLPMPLSVQPLE